MGVGVANCSSVFYLPYLEGWQNFTLIVLNVRPVAIVLSKLYQEIEGFPEQAGYEFNLFNGETIKLEPGGSFYIDGHKCSGVLFEGAALC